MMSAELTPVGLKQPMESPLDEVVDIGSSELDRSAIGTDCSEQRYRGQRHDLTIDFRRTFRGRSGVILD